MITEPKKLKLRENDVFKTLTVQRKIQFAKVEDKMKEIRKLENIWHY